MYKVAPSPEGICLLGNGSAGFRVSLGPCSRQLQSAGNLPGKNRIDPGAESCAFWRQSLLALLLGVLFLAAAGPLSAQVSGKYRVNAKKSRIEIHLFKGGFLSSLEDNHLILLTRFSGTADLSRTGPWTAALTGEAGSMKVIDPGSAPSEREEVQETMLGPGQLDVKHYPLIELHSVSFDSTDHDTAWHLEANVKLHGVTQIVDFSLDCHQAGDRLEIRGEKMFKLTEFGIQPYSAGLGAVRIKNAFEVTYKIVLDRIH